MLTVIDTDGHQLGHAISDADGHYAVTTNAAGSPHLLVVQWQGTPHVEALGGATGPQHRDIVLAPPSVGPRGGGRHAASVDAPTVALGAQRA